METFATLIDSLDQSTGTTRKVDLIAEHLHAGDAHDNAWSTLLLMGEKRRRLMTGRRLRDVLQACDAIPDWLFDDCQSHVGDSAETLALLWPQLKGAIPPQSVDPTLKQWISTIETHPPLHWWMEQLLPALAALEPQLQSAALLTIWSTLPDERHFLFNKLLTGGFRIGVARGLVVKAIAKGFALEEALVLERLMAPQEPSQCWFEGLTATPASERVNRGPVPYPFFLASPLQSDTLRDTPAQDWWVEHKWDGIRGQLIKRESGTYLWSRGEELINEQFPELIEMADSLPDDTVLDGEVICWRVDANRPQPFSDLQRRLGRKSVSRKLREECPICFVAYDLLESQGQDRRSRTLEERLNAMNELLSPIITPRSAGQLRISAGARLSAWETLDTLRHQAVQEGAEGLMLKQMQSPYLSGRKRGSWWKHKRDPMTLDAVLIYAQAGRGRRANLFTDYTFALWDRRSSDPEHHQLVTFAKAYSGLNDREILELDRWIRSNTRERFGPTRAVHPELVFEIGFEGIQPSKRHKCGLAVRFPRILRWRQDRSAESANAITDAMILCDEDHSPQR